MEEAGGRAEDVTGDGVLLPVPLACRFWPCWRYASMPSMFRSSKLNADEKAARSTRARESQRLRCMVGGCGENPSQSERKLRTGVWVYGRPGGLGADAFHPRLFKCRLGAVDGGQRAWACNERV